MLGLCKAHFFVVSLGGPAASVVWTVGSLFYELTYVTLTFALEICLVGKMVQRYTIQAVIYPGDTSGYVAECLNLAVVTQGQTLDETVQNLREALLLHLAGEDLAAMGLASCKTFQKATSLEGGQPRKYLITAVMNHKGCHLG